MSQDHTITVTILGFLGWVVTAVLGWTGCAWIFGLVALLFLLLWVVTAIKDSQAGVSASSVADTWQEAPVAELASDYDYFVPDGLRERE